MVSYEVRPQHKALAISTQVDQSRAVNPRAAIYILKWIVATKNPAFCDPQLSLPKLALQFFKFDAHIAR